MSAASCFASRSTSPAGTTYRASSAGGPTTEGVDTIVVVVAPGGTMIVVGAAVVGGTVSAPGSTPALGECNDPKTRKTMVVRAATPIAAKPNRRRTVSPYVTLRSPVALVRVSLQYVPNQ